MGSATRRLRGDDLLNGAMANQIRPTPCLDYGATCGRIEQNVGPENTSAADSCDPVTFLTKEHFEKAFELGAGHRIDSSHTSASVSLPLAH